MSDELLHANGLSNDLKRQLKTTVIGLRRSLEEDLGRELRRLGFDPKQTVPIPIEDLDYLNERDKAARLALEAALAKEQEVAETYPKAVESVRREAAYTHLNRLVGLKCLELRGVLELEGDLTEAVTCRPEFGGRSKWLWTLRDREAKYRHGEEAEELLWREGLEAVYHAISPELGVLFDPDDPYAQVWPSHRVLMEAVSALNELPEEGYRADELLGWVYQYFQTEEKDRVFEEVRTKKKKISGPDIIPVTSLYTERYMVDFLLQNSIGTRWMEMFPDSKAKEAWPYYVEPATPYTRAPQAVKEWTILDPCVGSGHFLVVAFDLLVQLYAEERVMAADGQVPKGWVVSEEQVAETILEKNLHGIDIDLRSVQLAALALYLKAKDHGLKEDGEPPAMNLVAADAVLTRGEVYEALIEQYKDDPAVQEAIEAIWSALENVRELGSLVRVEEEVDVAVRKVKEKEDKEAPLLSSIRDWEAYKCKIIDRIKDAFEAETQNGDIAERIFKAEGRKGIGLVELLSRKYDVVCTNPPYMTSRNMAGVMRDYLRDRYKGNSYDLYVSFIDQGIHLLVDRGMMGMVSQASWAFNSFGKNLRSLVLKRSNLSHFFYLGPHAFREISGEKVKVALQIFEKARKENELAWFIGVNESSISGKIKFLRSFPSTPNEKPIIPKDFRLMPKNRFLFEGIQHIKRILESQNSDLEMVGVTGVQTNDKPRWIRYNWEIDWSNDKLRSQYSPYPNGGELRRYLGNLQEVLNLSGTKQFVRGQQKRFLSSSGAAFSKNSSKGFSARYKPPGCYFDNVGSSVFIKSSDSEHSEQKLSIFLLGYLNSLPILEYLETVHIDGSFLPGSFNKFYPPKMDAKTLDYIQSISSSLYELASPLVKSDLTEFEFNGTLNLSGVLEETEQKGFLAAIRSSLETQGQILSRYVKLQRELDSQVGHLYGLDEEWLQEIRKKRYETHGIVKKDEADEGIGDDTARKWSEDWPLLEGTYHINTEQALVLLNNRTSLPNAGRWIINLCERYLQETLLRMLGYAWPLQSKNENGRFTAIPDEKYIDSDGIIPLTPNSGERTLLERLYEILEEYYGVEGQNDPVKDVESILGLSDGAEWGEQSPFKLESWLEKNFFPSHISLFRQCPIVWHLSSPNHTFQAFILYQKFSKDRLRLLRARYVRHTIDTLQRELNEATGTATKGSEFGQIAKIESRIFDIQDFDSRLGMLLEGQEREARIWCPWKSPDEQPVGWDPDINDGVRVNIAPVQRLGLLKVDVLSKKDLDSLLAPEGRN